MTPETRTAIDAHGIQDYPRESCGLIAIVDGAERYFRCRNIGHGTEHFVMCPQDYADVEERGEIVMVVHSHPNMVAKPSQGDRVACEKSNLPWFIVAVWKEPGDLYPRIAGDCVFEPTGYQAPLVGRQFFFGILDCYTLIKDWYERERGIILPEFERRDNFWKDGTDLYAQYAQVGFVEVTDGTLEVGDVIMMQIRAPIANHAGIYLGEGLILHHMMGQLSSRDPYARSYYHKMTRKVVRYVG